MNNLREIKTILGIQVIIIVACSLLGLCAYGDIGLRSGLLGGLVFFLPNGLFAFYLFRHQGAHEAKKIVSGLYKGAALKLIVTAIMFALVFQWATVVPVVFFMSFIVGQLVIWVAPVVSGLTIKRFERG